MLDDDTVTAKTVNGFQTKLEREQAIKTGLFLDPEAIINILNNEKSTNITHYIRSHCGHKWKTALKKYQFNCGHLPKICSIIALGWYQFILYCLVREAHLHEHLLKATI